MISKWSESRVLITGGLGFIGSNLAHRLVSAGSKVTILDSLNPMYGGNRFNIVPVEKEIELVVGDIRDQELMNSLVKDKHYIFDLAAQVSHSDSLSIPFEDLDVSCKGRLVVLEACRKINRDTKIVFASSRMVYGRTGEGLVDESSPTQPLGLYAIHKLVGEMYLRTYWQTFGIKSAVLRISNPYGERQQIKHGKYSLPGWFMRLAMENKPIRIFGDGLQLRDYIYIQDLVEAFLEVAKLNSQGEETFNCGSGVQTRLKDMAETVLHVVGKGSICYVDWPKEYSSHETGNSCLDISKLKTRTSWAPRVSLSQGIASMAEYYDRYKENYL